jgi:hypothetical protein
MVLTKNEIKKFEFLEKNDPKNAFLRVIQTYI